MPINLTVNAACDNALATYVDDQQQTITRLRCDRPLAGDASKISRVAFVEPGVWDLAYFYVAAWSDLQVAQWMKATLSSDAGPSVSTGHSAWRVKPFGTHASVRIECNGTNVSCSDIPPSAGQVAAWLANPGAWKSPAASMVYGDPESGAAAIWYNSGRQSGSVSAPFSPGFDHGEPLLFRFPMIMLASCLELYFPFDEHSTLINDRLAQFQLARLAEQLLLAGKEYFSKVVISGHTSEEGSAEYNLKLSKARAKHVATALAKASVPQTIESDGFGFTKPKDGANGKSPVNRRVEIELQP